MTNSCYYCSYCCLTSTQNAWARCIYISTFVQIMQWFYLIYFLIPSLQLIPGYTTGFGVPNATQAVHISCYSLCFSFLKQQLKEKATESWGGEGNSGSKYMYKSCRYTVGCLLIYGLCKYKGEHVNVNQYLTTSINNSKLLLFVAVAVPTTGCTDTEQKTDTYVRPIAAIPMVTKSNFAP